MADETAAAAAGASCCCFLCGLMYDSSAGRTHGVRFQCYGCNAADKMLRRNLGSRKELESIPDESQKAFFQRLQEEKKTGGKQLPWKTVRAQLIALQTTRHISETTSDITTEELPLTVWETRGWPKETVEACPREYSETLKLYLYKVPTKKVVWKEIHQQVSERILKQEQEARKPRRKKGKKAGSEDDMDLPEEVEQEKDAQKNEKKEEKAAEVAARKTQSANTKKNMLAAKSIGQLSNDLQAMTKAYKKVSNLPDNVEAACKDAMAKVELWVGAAKSTMQLAEDERAKAGELALPELPYDMVEVRTLHQTCTEVIKNLKPHSPAPKPKPAPKRKAEAENKGEDTGKEKPPTGKRLRGKTAN